MANEFKVKNGVITPAVFNVANSDLDISASGTGKLKLNGLSWPSSDGTANYVLTTNGSGVLSWAAGGGGGGGGGGAGSTVTVDTFLGTGAQTAFTLTATPIGVNYTTVTINGVSQQRTQAYTVSGTTLTFTEAPPVNSIVEVATFSATISGVASQLSVGRTISITGDLTYTSDSFTGAANVTGTGTLANTGVTSGTYVLSTITVDSKGRVTDASGGIGKAIALNAGLAML